MTHQEPVTEADLEQKRKRFEEWVMPLTESGCWIWMGVRSPKGYGSVYIKGINKPSHRLRRPRVETLAHRVAWRLYKGEIPDGLYVLHKCDVKCCTNPEHLFLGTHTDNMRDATNKGRWGACRGRVLREVDAQNIRAIYEYCPKATQKRLAKIYNVSAAYISALVNRRAWRKL
jgi:hypothetical protein